jgi:Domain of unknown function (DUF6265)
MKLRLVVLLPLLATTFACATGQHPPPAAATPPHGPLARLSFMTGCWRGADGDGVVEEQIGPADSTLMLSTARYIHADRVTSFEFLAIEAADGGAVVMTPYLRGKMSSARFALKPGADGNAVFEDPTHEFPKRVIYRRDGAEGLVGRIEGDDPTSAKEWRMRRCAD